jgi:hypothetical protein
VTTAQPSTSFMGSSGFPCRESYHRAAGAIFR